MYPLIIAALLLILLGSWLLSVRHKLSVLDENAGSAMSQIGVQLASRFDALNMLLRLPELYALPSSPPFWRRFKPSRHPLQPNRPPPPRRHRPLSSPTRCPASPLWTDTTPPLPPLRTVCGV